MKSLFNVSLLNNNLKRNCVRIIFVHWHVSTLDVFKWNHLQITFHTHFSYTFDFVVVLFAWFNWFGAKPFKNICNMFRKLTCLCFFSSLFSFNWFAVWSYSVKKIVFAFVKCHCNTFSIEMLRLVNRWKDTLSIHWHELKSYLLLTEHFTFFWILFCAWDLDRRWFSKKNTWIQDRWVDFFITFIDSYSHSNYNANAWHQKFNLCVYVAIEVQDRCKWKCVE